MNANAETTKPPLTIISDEAMVKRAAIIVLLVNILPSMITLYSLRDMKVNRAHSTLNIVIQYARYLTCTLFFLSFCMLHNSIVLS